MFVRFILRAATALASFFALLTLWNLVPVGTGYVAELMSGVKLILLPLVVTIPAMILIPALRRGIFALLNRLRGRRSIGKDARKQMTREERSILAYMQSVKGWSEHAGVTRTITRKHTQSDGRVSTREDVQYPRIAQVEFTPLGVAVTYKIVRGTVPSDWNAERVGAAINATVEVEVVSPTLVKVTALTRDPLAQVITADVAAPDDPAPVFDFKDAPLNFDAPTDGDDR